LLREYYSVENFCCQEVSLKKKKFGKYEFFCRFTNCPKTR